MNKQKINDFFTILEQDNPEPKGELDYVNPFTLLVAVVLSAQATDIGVNKATAALFKIADNPRKMYDLGEETIKTHIKTIGLYNGKAKNVHALSKILIDKHAEEVPDTIDQLIKLPGVGRKTANVVLNIAFGQPTIAVDTHLFRVSNRTKIAIGKTPEDVEKRLVKIVPNKFKLHCHHWLILHGRYICKARSPNCKQCIVNKICEFKDKNI